MMITYVIPQTAITEILDKMGRVDGLNVRLRDDVTEDDEHFVAILDIELRLHTYQLAVHRPSASNDPSLFECWLFSGFAFNPLNPVAWIRWIALERKQLNSLEEVLKETIGLVRHFPSHPVRD